MIKKMKNKKLLTRIFALLASLVIVVAFAVPCFAENVQSDIVYQDFVIDSFEDVSAFLALNTSGIYSASLYNGQYSDHVFYGEIDTSSTIDFYGSFISTYDSYSTINTLSLEIGDDSVVGYSYLAEFSVDGVVYDDARPESTDSFDSIRLIIYDVPVSSSVPDDSTTPSSDMYSNLFNILKDAVYGSDVDLTGSQEYALTLISTILTYATILLPVIIVIIIVAWCFKRF